MSVVRSKPVLLRREFNRVGIGVGKIGCVRLYLDHKLYNALWDQFFTRAGKRFCIAMLLLVVVSVSSCSEPKTSLMIGDQIPSVTLTELSGKTVRIPEDLEGHPAIVHFWAIGCPSCTKEMKEMQTLNRYLSDRGLLIIAVNVKQSPEAVKAVVKQFGAEYTVLLDEDGKASKAYRLKSVPQTFFLDRKGRIRYILFSAVDDGLLTELALKLL